MRATVKSLSEQLEVERKRSAKRLAERDDAVERLFAVGTVLDGWRNVAVNAVRERDLMFDNLTETQRRCTELLDEVRALKRLR